MPHNVVGSGNGTLDFILLTESSGGSTNSAGSFNADNANTGMPTGNGNTTANESFVTSFGELRAFYRLNFPDGQGGSTVDEILLFVDVNEIGGVQTIDLDRLDIIRDYDPIYGDGRDAPHLTDITSALQNATNASFSGGTLLAALDSSPKVLNQTSVGAGFADQVIFTHVNPFDPGFSDSTRVLFHWESSVHSNGGETIFLSGKHGSNDPVPEPGTLSLLVAGLLGSMALRRTAPRA